MVSSSHRHPAIIIYEMNSTKVGGKTEASKSTPTFQSTRNTSTAYMVDDMKQQITKLKSDLIAERTRSQELRLRRTEELKQAKNDFVNQKGKELLRSRKSFAYESEHLSDTRDSTFQKEVEVARCDRVERALFVEGNSSRASSSLSFQSSSTFSAAVIANLQQELHSLKDSKRLLEQRLARLENVSGVQHSEPDTDCFSEQSPATLDDSPQDMGSNFISARDYFETPVPSMPSPKPTNHRTSDKSDSTFIIEADLKHHPAELHATNGTHSISSVGSEQSLVREIKCDRDVKESEKHWQLQKKVIDLNTHTTQLEKRVTALKEENEVLKKKVEEHKPTEEKVKQLKRRNAELASIARRLEDKVKQLQMENQKKVPSPTNESSPRPLTNRSRTKDRTAEKTDKDRVVEMIRDRFQELLKMNQSSQGNDILNKDFYSEQAEMENIIKVSAKERLQLEKQLVDEQHNPEVEAQLMKAAHLEQRNAELIDEVEKLTKFADDREKLEIEVVQRRIEVDTLEKRVSQTDKKCERLTKELQELLVKNTQLTIVNSDIQRQIEELNQMAVDYKSLSTSLAVANSECQTAKADAASCRETIQTLELELQYMKQVEQKKRQVEMEKQSLQEMLRTMQQKLDSVSREKEIDSAKHEQSLKKLELKLIEMETMYKEQVKMNEKKSLDLAGIADNSLTRSRTRLSDIEVQTEAAGMSVEKAITVSQTQRLNSENHNRDSHRSFSSTDCDLSTLKNEELEVNCNHNINISQIDLISNDLSTEPNRTLLKGSQQDAVQLMNGYRDNLMLDDEVHEDPVSSTPLLQVFQAIYDYDPEQCSPNEEPEAELVFFAGDYIFVYGDADEDGFYFGELLNGMRGMVPSNFVRKLPGPELMEFYSALNLDMQGDGGSINSEGSHPLLDFSYQEDGEAPLNRDARRLSTLVMEEYADKSLDISCISDSFKLKVKGVPDAPCNVHVESGPDHGCLMVSWLPVTIAASGTSNGARVDGYRIYINGIPVKLLSNPTGDHILLEADDLLDIEDPDVITVRTVATSGQESLDSEPASLALEIIAELMNTNVEGESHEESRYSSEAEAVIRNPEPDPKTRGTRMWQTSHEQGEQEAENEIPFTKNNLSLVEYQRQQTDHHEAKNICQSNSLHSTGPSLDGSNHNDDIKLLQVPTSTTNTSIQEISVSENVQHDVRCEKVNLSYKELGCMPLEVGSSSDPTENSSNITSSLKPNEVNGSLTEAFNSTIWKKVVSRKSLADSSSDSLHPAVSAAGGQTLELKQSSDSGFENGMYVNGDLNTHYECREAVDLQIAHGHHYAMDGSLAETDSRRTVTSEQEDNVNSSNELIDNHTVTSKKIRDDIPDSDLIDYSDDGGESLVESMDYDRESQVRIFIALFSYDPEIMSPNPDAATEELSFQEGQIIKIYGDKDQDGFFLGEVNNQQGLVPCNMISEVHFDDPAVAAELLDESQHLASQSEGSSRTSSRTSNFTSRTHSTNSMHGLAEDQRVSPIGEPSSNSERYVIALYNYDPHELSPNSDADEELSFKKGDVILILGDVDDDGFYYGQLNSRLGLVPSNFVREAPSSAVFNSITKQNRSSTIV